MRIVTCTGLVLLAVSFAGAAHATASLELPGAPPAVARGRRESIVFSAHSDIRVKTLSVTLGGKAATVEPLADDMYKANVDTVGLPNGPAPLVVTLTDELAATTSRTWTVEVDDPPEIAVAGLRDHGLVTGAAEIRITCTDTGLRACAKVWTDIDDNAGPPTGYTVSLAAFDGSQRPIHVFAQDTAGIVSEVGFSGVTIDRTPLAPLSRVPGEILEVDATRILFRSAAGLFLRDRGTGADTRVLGTAPAANGEWKYELVPNGVVWRTREPAPVSGEWIAPSGGASTGTLRERVRGGPNDGVSVYFCEADACKARNLSTGVVRTVYTMPPSAPFAGTYLEAWAASANGDVILVSSRTKDAAFYEGFILRMRDAAASQVAHAEGSASSLWGPVSVATDGTHVLWSWREHRGAHSGFGRALDDTPLDAALEADTEGEVQAQLSGGFVGYGGTRSDAPDAQVFVRRPDGTIDRRSVWTGGTRFVQLAADGEVAMGNRGRLYLRREGQPPAEVAANLGVVRSVDGGWIIAQGDTLRCLRAPCGPSNPIPPEGSATALLSATGGACATAGLDAPAASVLLVAMLLRRRRRAVVSSSGR